MQTKLIRNKVGSYELVPAYTAETGLVVYRHTVTNDRYIIPLTSVKETTTVAEFEALAKKIS